MLFSLMSPAVLISSSLFPTIYNEITDRIEQIRQISLRGIGKPENNLNAVRVAEDLETEDHITRNQVLPFMSETYFYSLLLNCLALIGQEMQPHNLDNSPFLSGSPFANSQLAMQAACNFIAARFRESISLEMVAKQIGFSKFYFERLFKEFTNMSFYQYVIKVRLSYAQQLLADPSLSITEIALRSGFSGASAFTRSFHKTTGLTPSVFRQMKQDISQS